MHACRMDAAVVPGQAGPPRKLTQAAMATFLCMAHLLDLSIHIDQQAAAEAREATLA